MRNDQDNKMDTNWKFYSETETTFTGWIFRHCTSCLSWAQRFTSDENGWISADKSPPEKGNYLAWEGKFWDRIYWDGEMWKSKWPPNFWKPIVPPEDSGERYVMEDWAERNKDPFTINLYNVLDTELGETVVDCIGKKEAGEIIDYLKRRDEC